MLDTIDTLGDDVELLWAMAACSWGLTCITRVSPTAPLLLDVVNRTIAFRGMCVPDTLRNPWWSSNAISGSVFTVAVSSVLPLLPILRCDSGEEGGVNVGNRSEVVARATSLSSIAFCG